MLEVSRARVEARTELKGIGTIIKTQKNFSGNN